MRLQARSRASVTFSMNGAQFPGIQVQVRLSHRCCQGLSLVVWTAGLEGGWA